MPYDADEVGSLTGALDFDGISPYLGLGWGKAPKSGKGFGFDLDVGVLFQGSPNVSLMASCGTAIMGTQACDDLLADVQDEEVSLSTDAEDFDVFPVVSAGISYTF